MLDFSALDLDVGDSSRDQLCPNCGGGANKEKSFVVTRTDNGYLFVCHRASCDYSGGKVSRGGELLASRSVKESPPKEEKTNPYKGYFVPDEGAGKYLHDRFGLENKPYNVSDTGRIMFPIRRTDCTRYGWVARAYPEFYKGNVATCQKAVNYLDEPDDLGMHFPDSARFYTTDTIIVVEDVVSAEKLSALGFPTASLLGTSMSFETAEKLVDELPRLKNLVVCLDYDALEKAAKLQKELGLVFETVSIKVLKLDPKDTPTEELNNVFRS